MVLVFTSSIHPKILCIQFVVFGVVFFAFCLLAEGVGLVLPRAFFFYSVLSGASALSFLTVLFSYTLWLGFPLYISLHNPITIQNKKRKENSFSKSNGGSHYFGVESFCFFEWLNGNFVNIRKAV